MCVHNRTSMLHPLIAHCEEARTGYRRALNSVIPRMSERTGYRRVERKRDTPRGSGNGVWESGEKA